MHFKDYAHLYLGARCLGTKTDRILEITPSVLQYCDWEPSKLKPILKRPDFSVVSLTPEETKYFLSSGVDLFGLIDAGLALDISTFDYDVYEVLPYLSYQQFIALPKHLRKGGQDE